MCEVCAIFGAGEHWSDFGRERNERFPFEDIRVYRQERTRRLELIGRLLARRGVTVEDWDGETALLSDRTGRSKLAPTLGDIWRVADDLSGTALDPLADDFLSAPRG